MEPAVPVVSRARVPAPKPSRAAAADIIHIGQRPVRRTRHSRPTPGSGSSMSPDGRIAGAWEEATAAPEFRASTRALLADPDLQVTTHPALYPEVASYPA